MAKRARAEQPLYRTWRPDIEAEADGADYAAIDVRNAARVYTTQQAVSWENSWPANVHVRNSITNDVFVVRVDREMVPEYLAGTPQPLEMKPATHALWSGRALCMDIRLEDKLPKDWPANQWWIDVKTWGSTPKSELLAPKCALCDKRVAGVLRALSEIGAGGS